MCCARAPARLDCTIALKTTPPNRSLPEGIAYPGRGILLALLAASLLLISAHPTAGAASTGVLEQWGHGPAWINGSEYPIGPVPSGLYDVVAVGLNDYHSLAARADGTVIEWGISSSGFTPSSVVPGLRNVVQVGCGRDIDMAVTRDGLMQVWNTKGPVGARMTVGSSIAINGNLIVGLSLDGGVWCYYLDPYTSAPTVRIADGLSNMVSVATSGALNAALSSDGRVYTFDYRGGSVTPWITGVTTLGAGGGAIAAALTNGTIMTLDAGYSYTNYLTWLTAGHTVRQLAVSSGQRMLASLEDGSVVGVPEPPAGLRDVSLIALSTSGRALAIRQVPATAPLIVEQPGNRSGRPGGVAEFDVQLRGVEPIQYQWMKGPAPLAGAVTPRLVIAPLQLSDAGDYRLAACGPFGCTTSGVMRLEVTTGSQDPIVRQVSSTAGAGAGSLREALADVNASGGGHIILTNATGRIPLTHSLPAIAFDTTLDGPGPELLSLSSPSTDGLLRILPGTHVTVSGVGFSGCSTTNWMANGAAISNAGTLVISSCRFTSNSTLASGGAIYSSGILSLSDSSFDGNTVTRASGGGGGALCVVSGRLDIARCSFRSNSVAGSPGTETYSGVLQYSQLYGGGDALGGALFLSDSDALLDRVQFQGNSATGGIYDGAAHGGGIFSRRTRLSMTNSILEGNGVLTLDGGQSGEAPAGHPAGPATGGGIHAEEGESVLAGSTLFANHLLSGNGGNGPNGGGAAGPSQGGALRISHGRLELQNCTICSNRTDAGYGSFRYGLYESCTVGGSTYGAGLYLSDATGHIAHCTIAGNISRGGTIPAWAGSGGAGCGTGSGFGSGLFMVGGSTLLDSSILLDEILSASYGNPAQIESLGYNLLGSPGGLTSSSPRDLWGLDPGLLALANNGGPTPTMALQNGSPAIDAVPPDSGSPTDQRGTPRPQGVFADIGAFESASLSPPTPPVIRWNDSDPTLQAGTPMTIHAMVTGTQPIRYEWLKDGMVIPLATEPWLGTEQVTMRQAGTYRLRVSNPQGTLLSGPIRVTVTMPEPEEVWTRFRPTPTGYFYPDGLAYGAGLWVALKNYAVSPILTSPDGQNWTPRPIPPGRNQPPLFSGIDYHGGRFVAVGQIGIYTSTNGITWDYAGEYHPTNGYASVVGGDSGFLIAGAYASASTTLYDYWASTDLTTWKVSQTQAFPWTIGFAAGVYLRVGASGYSRSVDLQTWTDYPLPQTPSGANIASILQKEDEAIMSIGQSMPPSRVMLRSRDGIEWSAMGPAIPGFGSLAYGHGLYVLNTLTLATPNAPYGSHQLSTSKDALNWTPRILDLGTVPYSHMQYGDGVFLGTGGGDWVRSANIETPAVTLRTTGDGVIRLFPDQARHAYGDVVSLTAVPGRWHRFERWGDWVTENPRSETLRTINDYTALFTPTVPLETVTFSGVPRTAPIGMPAILADGQLVTTPHLVRLREVHISLQTSLGNAQLAWSVDGSTPALRRHPQHRDFILRSSAHLRVVAYPADGSDPIEADPLDIDLQPAFLLSLTTPGGGRLLADPRMDLYPAGQAVTASAIPDPGWSFLGWRGGLDTTASVVPHPMDADLEAEGVFGLSLAVSATGGGQVTTDPAVSLLPFGTWVRLTAVPDPGKAFTGWAGAVQGTNPVLRLQVTNPVAAITALFGPLKSGDVTLSTPSRGRGEVVVTPGAATYRQGTQVTLSALPASGQAFLRWEGDASGSDPVISTKLTRSLTVTAVFTQIPLLSVAAAPPSPEAPMPVNALEFTLRGTAGDVYQLETASDVTSDWQPFEWVTNQLGTMRLVRPLNTNRPLGLFRALSPP